MSTYVDKFLHEYSEGAGTLGYLGCGCSSSIYTSTERYMTRRKAEQKLEG